MRKTVLMISMILITGAVTAQYDYAIGLRSGGTSGLTLKKNKGATALEGIVGFWDDGVSLTGLWEKNQMAFDEPGLKWYYGVGGHIAFYGDDFDGHGASWYDNPHDIDDGDFGIGIDGVVGLEYKIPGAPIAFDIGLKPYIEIVSEGGAIFSPDPGIGIKVAF
jgi:hypothetical protein